MIFFWETSCNVINAVLWIQITIQMILSPPLHKHVIYSRLCSAVSVTHMWLETKSSVKWVLLSNYKPSLFSLIVNHRSILSYTHFNNEAGKILLSANEETVIKDVLLCKHPYVHHLAEQIQGSLMSLHWLIKDTRRPPPPSTQCALYISCSVVNYNALLLSFINHSFITSQGLSWHLNS